MKGRNTKLVIIGIILAALVVGYYFYLSGKVKEAREEKTEITAVQNVLMKDLEHSYPPTPKEVLRYYCEITKCFYNEEYTEEELIQLAEKAQELYDEELIANKTQEQYLKDLKSEITQRKEDKCTISGYELSPSTDVKEYTKDGYTCATLYCTLSLKQNGQTAQSMEQFVLRKDAEGHWKIYGWQLVDASK